MAVLVAPVNIEGVLLFEAVVLNHLTLMLGGLINVMVANLVECELDLLLEELLHLRRAALVDLALEHIQKSGDPLTRYLKIFIDQLLERDLLLVDEEVKQMMLELGVAHLGLILVFGVLLDQGEHLVLRHVLVHVQGFQDFDGVVLRYDAAVAIEVAFVVCLAEDAVGVELFDPMRKHMHLHGLVREAAKLFVL